MSEKAREYTHMILDGIDATRSALDIQHFLELETARLAALSEKFPELHDQIRLALEHRRAYLAQEPL